MPQALREFIYAYANCRNIIVPTVIIMALLFAANLLFAFRNFGTMKKINRVLRNDNGNDIIRKIEAMKLSKRFEKMWDDYYIAYSNENTVSLSSYLIKNDFFIDTTRLFKSLSRLTAVIGVSAAATAAVMIPYLFDEERNPLICMFFILTAFEAFLEMGYALVAYFRKKRLSYMLEEFEILSMRKLPGDGVDFASRYVIERIAGLERRLADIKSGVKQLNARMDRQYKLFNNEEEEKQEENGQEEENK